ncbi:MAG: cyclic pyranopterin monophosphate synthase MoaC [Deltaproteobacteria bacterium]|nr:cyclic pyranopterin monophosphate synthase MoaC [Deltaproteobacteria bacterium]MBW2477659.1 cyclic pyranopterin monophosphate synthase MoaC [Deltaproteobacteria bacterium]MBW2520269.1 cyclic pyranopterin monophosphate synthase MoaC [Deltaproteobacteria bacterium]
MNQLTHFDADGKAVMVDVGNKAATERIAIARGTVRMQTQTLQRILNQELEKGDVLAVARLAGIMAAKKTPDIIPLCHPLLISSVQIEFLPDLKTNSLAIEASVKLTGQTGVEMEALTAVSVAALTVYDMCKAVDKTMTLDNIRLVEKSGGRSGHFKRQGESVDE